MSAADSAAALVAQACTGVAKKFGHPAEFAALAPGRVNLIGDHTDYNAGLAMPFAIPRYVAMAAAVGKRDDHTIVAYSDSDADAAGSRTVVPLGAEPVVKLSGWGAYLAGVLQGARDAGLEVPPLDLYCSADLPAGAGLSSSAALSLTFLTLLEVVTRTRLSNAQKIAIAQRAEHDYAGVPCGILDPFAIINAEVDKVMCLDCASEAATLVSWPEGAAGLLVIDSGVKHSLADGGYAQRLRECREAEGQIGYALNAIQPDAIAEVCAGLSDTLARRVQHVVSENARVRAATQAIETSDWDALGDCLYASHRSLAHDYEVSCAATDVLVAITQDTPGVYGARMTGGGFGGAVIVLGEAARLAEIGAGICARYTAAGYPRTCALPVRPVQGVREMPL